MKQTARQVKSPAKTGRITAAMARKAVREVCKRGSKAEKVAAGKALTMAVDRED